MWSQRVALVLVADAWSLTYRSSAVTYADSTDAVETMNGIYVVPDLQGRTGVVAMQIEYPR